jgi:hypothetical protein
LDLSGLLRFVLPVSIFLCPDFTAQFVICVQSESGAALQSSPRSRAQALWPANFTAAAIFVLVSNPLIRRPDLLKRAGQFPFGSL